MAEQAQPRRRPAGQLEGEVLRILWTADAALSAVEVYEALGAELAYNTVHTILRRLVAKGRVRRIGIAGRSTYRPVKDAASTAADQMHALLDTAGDRSEILMRFVTALSPDDEAALRSALDGDP